MKGFIAEFRAFALKGSVIDLAVAVVIGTAFGQITASLVDNIIMPLVGIMIGGVSFSDLTVVVGSATVTYGDFIQSIVDFLIIALAIFVVIKAFNTLRSKEEQKPEQEKSVEPSDEVKLLREIRDSLKQ